MAKKVTLSAIPDLSRRIPQGELYYKRLLELFTLRSNNDLKDKRFEEQCWQVTDTKIMPDIVTELVELMRGRSEVIGTSQGVIVRAGCYTRMAGMRIPPPPPSTGNRIVLNFGEADLFHFNPNVAQVGSVVKDIVEKKMGVRLASGLPERQVVLEENRYLELGSITSSNYEIIVEKKDLSFTRPMGYEEGKMVPRKKFTRSNRYLRIMIVIDLLTEQSTIDGLVMRAKDVIDNIDLANIDQLLTQYRNDDSLLSSNDNKPSSNDNKTSSNDNKPLNEEEEQEVEVALEAVRIKNNSSHTT